MFISESPSLNMSSWWSLFHSNGQGCKHKIQLPWLQRIDTYCEYLHFQSLVTKKPPYVGHPVQSLSGPQRISKDEVTRRRSHSEPPKLEKLQVGYHGSPWCFREAASDRWQVTEIVSCFSEFDQLINSWVPNQWKQCWRHFFPCGFL